MDLFIEFITAFGTAVGSFLGLILFALALSWLLIRTGQGDGNVNKREKLQKTGESNGFSDRR